MTESLKLFDTYEEYLDAHLVDEDLYYLKGDHDPNFVQKHDNKITETSKKI